MQPGANPRPGSSLLMHELGPLHTTPATGDEAQRLERGPSERAPTRASSIAPHRLPIAVGRLSGRCTCSGLPMNSIADMADTGG